MLRILVLFYYMRWLRRRHPEMFDGQLAAESIDACLEEERERRAVAEPPVELDPALSVPGAIELSDWYARYALDRFFSEPRHLHPGVHSHLTSSTVQLQATVGLLDPANDQVEL